MGIVYGIGDAEIDESNVNTSLKVKLKNDSKYNSRNMLALIFFVLIYIPCMATLVVVRKELAKIKYPLFLAFYTFLFAWILATVVYQVSGIFGL